MREALGVNWFDIIALIMVTVGVFVGRKRGMSLELLDVIQWLVIVFVGALLCAPFGDLLTDVLGLSRVVTYVLAYLSTAGVIKLLFLAIKRMTGEKLVGSDVFGNFEYYLGMTAGAVRFACITIFALALLHAKPVKADVLAAQIRYQNENLGQVYFPPYGRIQEAVFKGSFTGKLVEEYLSAQLITVGSSGGGVSRENIGQARAREVNDVMNRR